MSSASEKLKVLQDPLRGCPACAEYDQGLFVVVSDEQFVQIVAVIEVAESIPPWPAAGTQKPRRKLAEALAALDKKLGGE